jgi:NhaP-type Na+/H+ or K+/H+ antiporter
LPGLVFILLFGLFIGNLNKIKNNKWIQKLKPDHLHDEVLRFHELIVEGTFLIRSLFFLLFGFLIESAEILNTQSLKWAMVVCVIIIAVRFIQLKISKLPLLPLLFIAPRGLITVLLFLSIPKGENIDLVERSMIIQVIIISAVWMMLGLIFSKTETNK